MADEQQKHETPERGDALKAPNFPDAPPMPGGDGLNPSEQAPLPPPPTISRQVAQLVIIPAVIVLICVGISLLFGLLAGGETDINTYLLKLRQSGGNGRLAFDIQDPRYKDRSLAAYNIATMIPEIKDAAERKRVSDQLLEILADHTSEQEETLRVYLLLAVGQLGQGGGIESVAGWLDAKQAQVRLGAVRGILSWPNKEEARVAIPGLVDRLKDEESLVAASAAAALGELARREDAAVIPALRAALSQVGGSRRETIWNAAVALARLGDGQGTGIVADVLLDRTALAQLPADPSRTAGNEQIGTGMQDHVILSTLSAARDMTDPKIMDKIKYLAVKDPNPRVRKEAQSLIDK